MNNGIEMITKRLIIKSKEVTLRIDKKKKYIAKQALVLVVQELMDSRVEIEVRVVVLLLLTWHTQS